MPENLGDWGALAAIGALPIALLTALPVISGLFADTADAARQRMILKAIPDLLVAVPMILLAQHLYQAAGYVAAISLAIQCWRLLKQQVYDRLRVFYFGLACMVFSSTFLGVQVSMTIGLVEKVVNAQRD
ncbi:hypothetical protein [Achromobacter xylosoxidans]|uniref:hypothetical protein n=1 Tax=Alcaligenes xylosoxydans xylosoxydans TaxID=85698 RepID=UPI0012DF14C4|nr:hypothetical protein [Achromobacter xylosoxidans]